MFFFSGRTRARARAGQAELTAKHLSEHTTTKLLEWGNAPATAAFYVAARDGDPTEVTTRNPDRLSTARSPQVQRFFDEGGDVNTELEDDAEWRETALHAAARFGSSERPRLAPSVLLKKNAS